MITFALRWFGVNRVWSWSNALSSESIWKRDIGIEFICSYPFVLPILRIRIYHREKLYGVVFFPTDIHT